MSEPEQALLEVAVEAARMAGGLLAERASRGGEREVTSKSTPTDLVSEADMLAERAIRELLARRRPGDGFVGEEGGREDSESGLSWVVDPLDGTVNFLFGIPQWCVSVAVRDSSGAIAGARIRPRPPRAVHGHEVRAGAAAGAGGDDGARGAGRAGRPPGGRFGARRGDGGHRPGL